LGTALGVALITLAAQVRAADIGTAFTYQGSLEKPAGTPVTGSCDFRFGLWDAAAGGAQKGTSPQTKGGVSVSGGVFTVEALDFGAAGIDGTARWLEIEVRCPTGVGGFQLLTPRVELKPAPHALALPGLYTQQNVTSPNLIGGYFGNSVIPGALGATISGGGNFPDPNRIFDHYGTIGGGARNRAGKDDGDITAQWFATVGGGLENVASSNGATVGGGSLNAANATLSTVGGGESNTASATSSTVGGGFNNTASGLRSTIGGGETNRASSSYSTVGGGVGNFAIGYSSTVAGGNSNLAGGSYSFAAGAGAKVRDGNPTSSYYSGDGNGDEGTFVWADSTCCDFISTGPNQFLIRATGGVGIGTNFPSHALTVESPTTENLRLIGPGVVGSDAKLNFGDGNFVYIHEDTDDTLVINSFSRTAIMGGNVGIGTLTPASRLEIQGTTAGAIRFNPNNGPEAGIMIGSNNDGHELNVVGGDPDGLTMGGQIRLGGAGRGDGDVNVIQFKQNGSEVMRVKDGGNVGIGTTAPQNQLHVANTPGGGAVGLSDGIHIGGDAGGTSHIEMVDNGGVPYIDLSNDNAADFDARIILRGDDALSIEGTNVGVGRTPATNRLEVEGDASKTTSGSWAMNSDAAIKTDVRTLEDALSVIGRLRPVAFRYADAYKAEHPSVEDHDYYNYIAQEFDKVFPNSVKTDGGGLLQMDPYPATIYSVAAIQELHQIVQEKDCEIEELKAQAASVEQLEAKVAALEALVNKLAAQHNGGGR